MNRWTQASTCTSLGLGKSSKAFDTLTRNFCGKGMIAITEFRKASLGQVSDFRKWGYIYHVAKGGGQSRLKMLPVSLHFISSSRNLLINKGFWASISNNPRAKFACIRRMMGWCFVMHRGNKSILFNVHLLGNQWKQIVRLITIWCTLQLAHFSSSSIWQLTSPLSTQPYTCSYNPSQVRLN